MFHVAIKRAAVVLLLASAGAGAAEAQTAQTVIPPDMQRTCKCSSALVTLAGETASFHVTLDEYGPEAGVIAVMRFINQNGTVLLFKSARLYPGKSATLAYRGSGLVRVQAEIFEYESNIPPTGELTVMASVETFDGADAARLIGPVGWVPCALLRTP